MGMNSSNWSASDWWSSYWSNDAGETGVNGTLASTLAGAVMLAAGSVTAASGGNTEDLDFLDDGAGDRFARPAHSEDEDIRPKWSDYGRTNIPVQRSQPAPVQRPAPVAKAAPVVEPRKPVTPAEDTQATQELFRAIEARYPLFPAPVPVMVERSHNRISPSPEQVRIIDRLSAPPLIDEKSEQDKRNRRTMALALVAYEQYWGN